MTATSSPFGREISTSEYNPLRSLVGDVERSGSGNIVLRVGRENYVGGSWSQTEHVVLTAAETWEFIADLTANLIASSVEHGHEDDAREWFGDSAVDAWFRGQGEDPDAMRAGW